MVEAQLHNFLRDTDCVSTLKVNVMKCTWLATEPTIRIIGRQQETSINLDFPVSRAPEKGSSFRSMYRDTNILYIIHKYTPCDMCHEPKHIIY